jgi:hypothetical protein
VVDGELGTATPRRLIREPRVDAGDLALGALCGDADAVIGASIFICMTRAFVSYGLHARARRVVRLRCRFIARR